MLVHPPRLVKNTFIITHALYTCQPLAATRNNAYVIMRYAFSVSHAGYPQASTYSSAYSTTHTSTMHRINTTHNATAYTQYELVRDISFRKDFVLGITNELINS